jgi:phenolic acid decarboxylase
MGLAIEGRTFLYRYGSGLKLEGCVASGNRLAWKALTGPSQGKSGTEQAMIAEVRPNLFFISWVESSGLTASQTFDLDAMAATTYVTFDTPNGRQGALDRAILEEVHR